jgi:hypothetical protein
MIKFVVGVCALFMLTSCFGPSVDRTDSLIVIDAGHGGHDGGANIDGKLEKELVLQISKKLYEAFRDEGYDVYLTRSSDKFLTLGERTKVADKKDLMIALKGAGVDHGVICVIRYYGGIKLGKRGLIDAYGHTAKLLIDEVSVVDAVEGYEIEIIHPYSVKIDGILRSLGIDIRKLSPHYEAEVRWKLKVDKHLYNIIVDRMRALGDVKINIIKEVLVEVNNENRH